VTAQEKAAGTNGYFISFLESIRSDFPFAPAKDLTAYETTIDLWPLVSDPNATDGDATQRPPLTRLTGAALQGRLQITPTPGQRGVVRVYAKQKKFWDDIASDLRRMPKYKELAKASRP
jgi:hypothetical protein